jgi:hypothetical protein
MMRCPHGLGHSDEAKRAADNVNMHYQATGWNAVNKWCAIALQDGSSDHVLYDRRRDAVTHQHGNEQRYCYVKIQPGAMGICEAQAFLDFHRKAYDAGFRLVDPEHRAGGRELIVRGRPIETVAEMFRQFDHKRSS